MNTLLDLIGVIIGFSLVMLLLSLVVTGVVQFVQHILNLRGNNLQHGLEQLFEIVIRPTPAELKDAREKAAKGRKSAEEDYKALQSDEKAAVPRAQSLASRTMNVANFSPDENGAGSRLASLITKRNKTTWLELPDVLARLELVGETLGPAQKERLEKHFSRMETFLSKQFSVNIRIVTMLVGFIVAVYFQVSAIELLRNLSTDRELREKYVATAEGIVDQVDASLAALEPYENFSEEALVRLQEKHPDLANQIEEASGIGQTREEIIGELELILSEDRPDQMRAVVTEYAEILDGLHREQAGTALREAQTYVNELALLDITPWSRGWPFYADFRNIAGVLITGVFLTFGAPFWFNIMKESIKLKDMLEPRKGGGEKGPKNAPVTVVVQPANPETNQANPPDAK